MSNHRRPKRSLASRLQEAADVMDRRNLARPPETIDLSAPRLMRAAAQDLMTLRRRLAETEAELGRMRARGVDPHRGGR